MSIGTTENSPMHPKWTHRFLKPGCSDLHMRVASHVITCQRMDAQFVSWMPHCNCKYWVQWVSFPLDRQQPRLRDFKAKCIIRTARVGQGISICTLAALGCQSPVQLAPVLRGEAPVSRGWVKGGGKSHIPKDQLDRLCFIFNNTFLKELLDFHNINVIISGILWWWRSRLVSESLESRSGSKSYLLNCVI